MYDYAFTGDSAYLPCSELQRVSRQYSHVSGRGRGRFRFPNFVSRANVPLRQGVTRYSGFAQRHVRVQEGGMVQTAAHAHGELVRNGELKISRFLGTCAEAEVC